MQFLFDKEIVIDILRNIHWSLQQIRKRFARINSCEDFVKADIVCVCLRQINLLGFSCFSDCLQILEYKWPYVIYPSPGDFYA